VSPVVKEVGHRPQAKRRLRPAESVAGGGDGVDAAVSAGQGLARAAPAELDQFSRDRNRGLFRGPGTQVQADRGPQPGQFSLRQTCLAQAGHLQGRLPRRAILRPDHSALHRSMA
jgi:hypothetical protein